MLRNNSFTLRYISDIPYLLTIGQAIAEHKHSMQLNSTGVYIWDMLKTELSLEELIEKAAAHFEISKDNQDDYCEFSKDIAAFVSELQARGAITEKANPTADADITANTAALQKAAEPSSALHSTVRIAGITMALYGESDYYSELFDSFRTDDSNALSADIAVEIIRDIPCVMHEIPHISAPINGICTCPECNPGLKRIPVMKKLADASAKNQPESVRFIRAAAPILHHPDLTVFTEQDGYALYFNSAPQLIKTEMNSDASRVCIYLDTEPDDELRERLFHAIRMPFLFHALTKGYLMLHSASLIYRDKIWLFSASSGTGKSTHTNLWKEVLDIHLVNGDLNLILPGRENERPLVAGTPWCGTSGIFDTKSYELGGIILLKRGESNYCRALNAVQKRLSVLNRLISPLWDETMLDRALTGVNKIADIILICQLYCTIDHKAVYAVKEEIDAYLSE